MLQYWVSRTEIENQTATRIVHGEDGAIFAAQIATPPATATAGSLRHAFYNVLLNITIAVPHLSGSKATRRQRSDRRTSYHARREPAAHKNAPRPRRRSE